MAEARHRIYPKRMSSFNEFRQYFLGKRGIEIGGPSNIFKHGGNIPVYQLPDSLDNCNFSERTVWEGTINKGHTFVFSPDKAPGRQYCLEASNLQEIPDETYDFLLSSHCLEHLANPLKGLLEWKRVIQEGGVMLLVVPHRDGTFDHRRPVTTLEHILEDYESMTDEDDMTHLAEILALHDFDRDPGILDEKQFEERSRDNLQNRTLHHHVFDTRLAISLVDKIGMQILRVDHFYPYHIAVMARKVPVGEIIENARFGLHGNPPVWKRYFSSDE